MAQSESWRGGTLTIYLTKPYRQAISVEYFYCKKKGGDGYKNQQRSKTHAISFLTLFSSHYELKYLPSNKPNQSLTLQNDKI